MTTPIDMENTLPNLDDLDTVIATLRDLVTRRDEFGSLNSPHRIERLRALAKVGKLAADATWLELADQEREDLREAWQSIADGAR